MTQIELLELIANRENSGVEFKRDDVRPEQIAREIIAMANLKGGRVLLGVEDDGSISGLTRGDCERWVMDTVFHRYIDPPIIPYYEEIQTDQGRVAVITVSEGTTKPYAVIQNDRPDIYIRTGSTNQLATREQIIRMAQDSGLFHSETLPVSGAAITLLNAALFADYYRKYYDEQVDITNEEQLIEKLLRLDLIVKTEHAGYVTTIAGQILFGNNPGRFLPQTGFRIIHYRTDQPTIDTISDEVINAQVAELRNENGDKLIPGLPNIIMDYLQQKLSQEHIGPDNVTRERVWSYPHEVLRELVVNAIVHRDYTKANQNKIEIFNNRLEITSFGSLPNTLTIEKIKAGQQYPRNPIIIRVAKDYGFIDDRGLGIRRRVLPTLHQMGFPEPTFEPTEDYLKVIIHQPLV
jgi:ATP-dependent DNA helicase RecG